MKKIFSVGLFTVKLECALIYVYLKSLLFCRRYFVIPFFYNIILDLKEVKIFRLSICGRADCFTIFDIFCYGNYQLSNNWELIIKRLQKSINGQSFILDLGANLGFAARYFENKYADITVIGLEPSRKFIDVAMRNCKADIHEFAIGSGCDANFEETENSYASHLSEFGTTVKVMNANDLRKLYDNRSAFILKVDIEGAENAFFADYETVIEDFAVIFVEIHDWMDPDKIVTTGLWSYLSARSNVYSVLIKGDIICLVKIN